MNFCLTLSLFLLVGPFAVAASPKTHRSIDPDDAYKNNCMRCHAALPQYSPRMNKTIMLHMKQVANMPGDEAEAILRYLNGAALPLTQEIKPNTAAPSQ